MFLVYRSIAFCKKNNGVRHKTNYTWRFLKNEMRPIQAVFDTTVNHPTFEKRNIHICVHFSMDLSKQMRISPLLLKNEPPHDKNNKMACAPSEDSDRPGHPPSPIRVFAVRMKKAWVLSYPLSAQRRLWSDWAKAQADLSLCWAHMPFCWFCHAVAQMWNFMVPIIAK